MAESTRARLDDAPPRAADPVRAPAGPVTPVSAPVRGTDTVTVACKIPGGLILRVFNQQDRNVPMFGGGMATEKVALPAGEFTIRGPKHTGSMSGVPQDHIEYMMPGGYALTHGVPRDLWEQWLNDNKDNPIVKNKIVFASSNDDDARDEAGEKREVMSGMEPLDPKALHKRIPRARGEPRIETFDGPKE